MEGPEDGVGPRKPGNDELTATQQAASSDVLSPGSKTDQDAMPRSLSEMSLNLQMPCVGHQLYISGFGGVTNPSVLRQRGITHIVNMAHEVADSFPEKEGIEVRHFCLRDSDDEELGHCLPEVVDYIHDMIGGGGYVAVSCVAGVSRSASVVMAYRVRHEGVTLRQAFTELHQARPVVSPNLGFWRTLVDWEYAVRGDNSVVLQPFLCGLVPEIEPYREYAEFRMKLAFTREMIINWILWILILAVQIMGIVWF